MAIRGVEERRLENKSTTSTESVVFPRAGHDHPCVLRVLRGLGVNMNKWQKLVIPCLGALICSIAQERSSSAFEPVDNTQPNSNHQNATIYACQTFNCGWIDSESIQVAGDVDWSIPSCGFNALKLQKIIVDLNSAAGDLDIAVYRLDGTLIGSSTSSTSRTETVITSSTTANALVLKVYGFGAATGKYTVRTVCG